MKFSSIFNMVINRKYHLDKSYIKIINNDLAYRIVADRDIYRDFIDENGQPQKELVAKKGDLGGYVTSMLCLPHNDSSWIFDYAVLCVPISDESHDFELRGDAIVYDKNTVLINSTVAGKTKIKGHNTDDKGAPIEQVGTKLIDSYVETKGVVCNSTIRNCVIKGKGDLIDSEIDGDAPKINGRLCTDVADISGEFDFLDVTKYFGKEGKIFAHGKVSLHHCLYKGSLSCIGNNVSCKNSLLFGVNSLQDETEVLHSQLRFCTIKDCAKVTHSKLFDSTVSGDSYVANNSTVYNSTIEKFASVNASEIQNNCLITDKASVQHSVLGADSQVRDRARVVDSKTAPNQVFSDRDLCINIDCEAESAEVSLRQ